MPNRQQSGGSKPKREAKQTKREAESAAKDVKQSAKSQAAGMKQQAKQRGQAVKQEAKQKAKNVGKRAKSRASQAAESQKGRAANKMHGASDRLDQKAQRMQAQGGMKAKAGQAAGRTGDALDRSADYLQTHRVGTIQDDLKGQIRRHPFLSVGAAMGSGFLLGNMLSGEDEEDVLEEHPEWQSDGYDRYAAHPPETYREPPAQSREHDRGMMGQLKGSLGKAVASGVSAMVAKKLNERIKK